MTIWSVYFTIPLHWIDTLFLYVIGISFQSPVKPILSKVTGVTDEIIAFSSNWKLNVADKQMSIPMAVMACYFKHSYFQVPFKASYWREQHFVEAHLMKPDSQLIVILCVILDYWHDEIPKTALCT